MHTEKFVVVERDKILAFSFLFFLSRSVAHVNANVRTKQHPPPPRGPTE